MTNEEYHGDTSRISKSGLDLIRRSPLHYWNAYLNPNRPPREEKSYFTRGTASHALILEPDLFEREYYLFDDSEKVQQIKAEGRKNPRATSAYKEWKAEIEAENAGRTALPPSEYEYYRTIQQRIKEHPIASDLLSQGIAEKTIFWEDFETGAKCKCRPDWLDTKNQIIVDLKFVQDASPTAFGKAAYNHRYHVQAPFYYDGVLASDLDFIPQAFAFIAVETNPPYPISVFITPAEVMKLGRKEYTEDLEKYAYAVRTGVWEGYPQDAQELQLPRWAYKQ